jgi:hypothetical protein
VMTNERDKDFESLSRKSPRVGLITCKHHRSHDAAQAGANVFHNDISAHDYRGGLIAASAHQRRYVQFPVVCGGFPVSVAAGLTVAA